MSVTCLNMKCFMYIVNIWKAHQEIVSNLIYTETWNQLFLVIQNQLLKCFFIVWLQGRIYSCLWTFSRITLWFKPTLEIPKTVVRSRYENGPKIFVDRNSNSPIHDSWRELFKAIPVYLFLTALWLSPVCMLCAFKAFFFAQFFHFSIGQFHFATWAGNYSCKNNL